MNLLVFFSSWKKLLYSLKIPFLLLLFIFLISGSLKAKEWPAGWSQVNPLNPVSINSSRIGLSLDNEGRPIFSWVEGGRSRGSLYYRFLHPDGSPSTPILLSQGEFFTNPRLIIDEKGFGHVVFAGRREGREVIYYICFDPKNTHDVDPIILWESPFLVSDVDLLMAGGDNLILLWSGRDEGTMDFDIFMMPLTTSLEILGPPVNLTKTKGISGRNTALIKEGEIHLLWTDFVSERYHLYYKSFQLDGEPLGERKHLDTVFNLGSGDRPSILIDTNRVLHLLYSGDSTAGGLLPATGGLTYMQIKEGEVKVRSQIVEGRSTMQRPFMDFVKEGILGILWQDNRGGPLQVYYLEIHEGGEILKGPMALDISSRASHAPLMVVDSQGYQYVFWFAFDEEGRHYQLSTINTRYPAFPSIWYRMGLDPDYPLTHLLFVLLANLLLSLLLTFIHFWVYLIPLLLLSFFDKKGLLRDLDKQFYQFLIPLFAFLFFLQGIIVFNRPIGSTFSFQFLGFFLSSLVTITFVKGFSGFSLRSSMNRLVVILLWLFWFHYFTFIPQVMEWL